MALDISRKTRFVIHLHDRNINFVKSKNQESVQDEVEFFKDGKLQSKRKTVDAKDSSRKPLQNSLALIATLQGSDANGVNKLPNSKSNEMFVKMAAGLHNPGINICFMNVILQVIVHSPYLAPALFRSAHSKVCQNAERRLVCVMCTLESHIKKALSSRCTLNNPFVHITQKLIWRHYKVGRQEDAFIYLKHLFEALIKGCYGSKYPYTSSAVIPQSDLMRSIIGRLFGGFLLNVVICNRCNYKSEKLEPCFDVSVDIYRANKLVDLLNSFVKAETLDNSNKYNCPSCKRQQRATKALSIYRAPRIMNIVLKRFEVGVMGCEKAKKDISYPLSFSMSLKNSKQNQPVWVTYDLYAVVCHLGSSLHMGHYVTFIKGQHGFWTCFNDSVVTNVSQNNVLSLKQEAYLLFYAVKDECVQISDLVLNDNSISNTFTTAPVPQNRNIYSTIAHYRKDVLREDEVAEENNEENWNNVSKFQAVLSLPGRMRRSADQGITPVAATSKRALSELDKIKGMPERGSPESNCALRTKKVFLTRRQPSYKLKLMKLLYQQVVLKEVWKELNQIRQEIYKNKMSAVKQKAEDSTQLVNDDTEETQQSLTLDALKANEEDTWSDAEVDETYEELRQKIHPALEKRSQDDIDYDKGKTKKVRKPQQMPLGDTQVVQHGSGAEIAVKQKSAFDSVLNRRKHSKRDKKRWRNKHRKR